MLEDHPIRDPSPLAAQRMAGRDECALGQQRRELDPQGLHQADWQNRHGASTAEMARTSPVAGARAWLLLLFSSLPIVGRSNWITSAASCRTWSSASSPWAAVSTRYPSPPRNSP